MNVDESFVSHLLRSDNRDLVPILVSPGLVSSFRQVIPRHNPRELRSV